MFNESLINRVRIAKGELLSTLLANRDHHGQEVAQLQVARRDEIEERLQEILQDMSEDVDYQPEPHLHFPEIIDHTDDYNRAIQMVELSVDDVIELEESQFSRLVMDEWDWKGEMLLAQTTYADKIGGRRR